MCKMPYSYGKRKFKAITGGESGSKAKKPKLFMPRYRNLGGTGNRALIPLMHSINFDFTADPVLALQWDCTNQYLNNAGTAVNGLTQLHATWELMRVHKVEITILPSATDLSYGEQTVTAGQTNIPYIYEGIDYVDPVNGAASGAIQQNPYAKIHLFNRPIKRTIYPRLEGSNGIIDVGLNRKNLFIRSDSLSTQRWNGFVMFGDMVNQVWTYSTGRIVCKIYYECMNSK